MSSGPIEIRYGGARYAVVRRDDVHRGFDEADARRFVRQGLREHGLGFARQLEQLAERLGGWAADDPITTVVDALVSGRLVVVRSSGPPRLLSEAEHTDIREIGGGEVIDPMIGGDTPEPQRPQQFTWVSFEVVDERGVRAEGSYRLGLDAKVVSGALAERVHRFDELRELVGVEFVASKLRWSPATGPTPSKPPSSQQRKEGMVCIELVDDHGSPLAGDYSVTAEDGSVVDGGRIVARLEKVLSIPPGSCLMLTSIRAE